jgi:hypothetical protein
MAGMAGRPLLPVLPVVSDAPAMAFGPIDKNDNPAIMALPGLTDKSVRSAYFRGHVQEFNRSGAAANRQ